MDASMLVTTPTALPSPSDARRADQQALRDAAALASAATMYVNAVSGGLAQLTTLNGDLIDEWVAVATNTALAPGDLVLVAPQIGPRGDLSRIVVDRVLTDPPPAAVAFVSPLSLASLDPSGGTDGQVVTLVDDELALATAPMTTDRIVVDHVTADASDTTSTAAISTFQQAYSRSVTLPAGTWTIYATAWLMLKNSAGNNAQLRIQVDGTPGGTRTVPTVSGSYQTAMCHCPLASVAGGRSVTVLMEFHGVTSGTTSAANPAMLTIAQRTA
jgi:hypothetical protein